ncbi:MAG TPA: IS66 family insertion sequence hypothetical protein [Cytophagales bacterium]|nr:IS66 family insertion sequence hypothetical protein [Cytophagales bacterium]
MNVQKVTHEVRLQRWEKLVQECRSSGKTIALWCSENRINIKTYYHWQKIVCQATCQEFAVNQRRKLEMVPMNNNTVFAELNLPGNNTGKLAVTIHRNDTEINIYYGADPTIIETALSALGNRC